MTKMQELIKIHHDQTLLKNDETYIIFSDGEIVLTIGGGGSIFGREFHQQTSGFVDGDINWNCVFPMHSYFDSSFAVVTRKGAFEIRKQMLLTMLEANELELKACDETSPI